MARYDPNYVMPYGKYAGVPLSRLVEQDPAYLRWAAAKLDDAVAVQCEAAWPHATDEYTDDDSTRWLPSKASELTVCYHCDGAIAAGYPMLESEDGDRLHIDCWDGHWGFTHAMSEDEDD